MKTRTHKHEGNWKLHSIADKHSLENDKTAHSIELSRFDKSEQRRRKNES